MKILHLIYTNGIAGAEKYLRHLLPPLKEYGIECHLIIVCAGKSADSLRDYCVESENEGVPTTLFTTTRSGFFYTAFKINKYLKKNGISVVHSHMLNSDVLATIIKVLFNSNLVIISTKHGYKESILKQNPNEENILFLRKEARGKFYYYITRFVLAHSKYNYAVSKVAALLYYNLGLTKEEMPYIHHGVTIKQIPKETGINQYRLSSSQLVTVGRLEEVKGHSYLLEAMPIIKKKFPGIRLLIIGEGSEKANMEHAISRLGIAENVTFIGFTNDPYSYISNSDVVVLPSLFETFGLVYIEAFALNTPVVAFSTASSKEIIQNNITGLLAIPKDHTSLAEKVLYLLENPEVSHSITAAAQKKYAEHFSAERMVAETAAFYKKISN